MQVTVTPEPSQIYLGNGEDVKKTAQSMMRRANPNITMGIYTHPVKSKRGADEGGGNDSAAGERANCGNGAGHGVMCTKPFELLVLSC